jgi:hypothetical protein
MNSSISRNRAIAGLALFVTGAAVAEPQSRPYTQPVTTAPQVENASPNIDGRVDYDEWQRASRFGDFLVVKRLAGDNTEELMQRAARNSTLHLLADAEGLYLAATAEQNPLEALTLSVPPNQRDGPVWFDDAFEFVIYNPDADRGVVLIITAAGAFFDGEFTGDAAADPRVTTQLALPDEAFASSQNEDTWSVELFVPWDEMGGPPEDDARWRFNVKRYEPSGVMTAWSPARDVAGIESSGTLRFSPTVQILTRFNLPDAATHTVADVVTPVTVEAGLNNRARQPQHYSAHIDMLTESDEPELVLEMPAVLTSMGFSGTNFPLAKVEEGSMGGSIVLQPSDPRISVTATYHPVPGQQSVARMIVSDATNFDDPLHEQFVPFVWSEPVAFPLSMQRWLLTNGTIELTVPPLGVPESASDADRFRAEIFDTQAPSASARIASSQTLDDQPLVLDIATLDPGNYRMKVTLMRGLEDRIARELELTIPETPEWVGNDLGKFDGVLPPWEPLRTADGVVTTTNRSYDFGDSVFPQQITVSLERGEQPLLAAPMRLLTNGQPMQPEGPVQIETQTDARRVMLQEFRRGDLRLRVRGTLEYDGFLFYEIESQETAEVASLVLETDMLARAATHYYRGYAGLQPINQMDKSDWPWGDVIGDDGLTLGFVSSLRVHDLDHGLEFNFEQDWDWRHADSNRKLVVEPPTDDKTRVHIRFVDMPGGTEVAAGSRFDFGLAALPLKPFELMWDELMLGNTTGIYDDVHFQKVQPARDAAMWLPGRVPPSQINDGVFVRYPLPNRLDGSRGELEIKFKALDETHPDLFWLDFGNPSEGQGLVGRLVWENGSARLRVEDSQGQQATTTPVRNPSVAKLTWQGDDRGTQFTVTLDNQSVGLRSRLRSGAKTPADAALLLGGNTRIAFDEVRLVNAEGVATIDDSFDEDFAPNDYLATVSGGIPDRTADFDDGRLVLDVQADLLKHDVHHRMGMVAVYNHWHARDNFLGPWYEIDGPDRVEQYDKYHTTVKPTGVKYLPYFLKNISINDPWWADFGSELAIQPTHISFDHAVISPNGPGADFKLWGVERVLSEMDADYIHMDFGLPFPDASLGNGAGSIGPDGELRFSYPHLAHRAMYKRIYKLCLDHDAHFVPHTTPGVEASYGGFMTAGLTGEQEEFWFDFNNRELYANPVRSYLSDARYLSHYPGMLIGVPHYALRAEHLTLLTGDVLMVWGSYWTQTYGDSPGTEDGEAGGHLKRDGAFRPFRAAADHELRTGGMMTRFAPYLPPILKDFGDARFVPFFRNQDLVTVSHEDDVRVSVAMKRDAPEALLLVGNLASTSHDAVELSVNFEALGVGSVESSEVYDPVMKRVVPHNAQGELTIDAPKEHTRLLIARPAFRP